MALTWAQMRQSIEEALEMSELIGNPAALVPEDLGLYNGEWRPEDFITLAATLRSRARGYLRLPSAIESTREFTEVPSEISDESVYVLVEDETDRVVLAIGASGWIPDESPGARGGILRGLALELLKNFQD
jgi:hypothetical protein